jgi:hypothetical protein
LVTFLCRDKEKQLGRAATPRTKISGVAAGDTTVNARNKTTPPAPNGEATNNSVKSPT